MSWSYLGNSPCTLQTYSLMTRWSRICCSSVWALCRDLAKMRRPEVSLSSRWIAACVRGFVSGVCVRGVCVRGVCVRHACENGCEGCTTYYGGFSSCVLSLVRRQQCCDGIAHRGEPMCAGHTVNLTHTQTITPYCFKVLCLFPVQAHKSPGMRLAHI